MAKIKEVNVAERLKALYNLQLIDSQLDEISYLKGELPIEVEDLKDIIEGLTTRTKRLEESIKETERSVNIAHAQIKESEALLEKYQRQSNDVKNNREYEALMKEIEISTLDIRLKGKEVNEYLALINRKRETLEETQAVLAEKNTELERKKEELEEIIRKTDKEEEKLRKESEKARKKIEERMLLGYDKIRGSYKNGLAVVSVQRESCGGCYNQIPPQMQVEIRHRTKIMLCEHCGRIMVDEDILAG
jgi:predicted  nucleic acid-binding Zn-ribbon protein